MFFENARFFGKLSLRNLAISKGQFAEKNGKLSFTFGKMSFTFSKMSFAFGKLSFTFGKMSFMFGKLRFGNLSFGKLSLTQKKRVSLPKLLYFLRTSTCVNHPALLVIYDKTVCDDLSKVCNGTSTIFRVLSWLCPLKWMVLGCHPHHY